MRRSSPRVPERPVILEVNDLERHFDVSPPALERMLRGKKRVAVKALDGVSFTIRRGETFSLVGESGCGKTTVARCIVGLYRPTAGNIVFDGIDLGRLRRRKAMAPVRRRMQMIFQDPYASLNPRWRRIPNSSSATSRLPRSTCRCRRRSSI